MGVEMLFARLELKIKALEAARNGVQFLWNQKV
jgi:hypothetical protein